MPLKTIIKLTNLHFFCLFFRHTEEVVVGYGDSETESDDDGSDDDEDYDLDSVSHSSTVTKL